MTRAALVVVWMLFAARAAAEVPCEDCWTDKCPEMKGIAPKCAAPKAAPKKKEKEKQKPREQACSVGKERGPDTAGQCCWRGQAWNGVRCVGTPTACPDGYVADRATEACVVPPCTTSMVRALDGVHCCWPGQAWSSFSKQCVGVPQCPADYSVEGARCVSPSERAQAAAEAEAALRRAASADEATQLRAQVEEERRLREQAEASARAEREQRERIEAERVQAEMERRAQTEREAAARAEAARQQQQQANAEQQPPPEPQDTSGDDTFLAILGGLLGAGAIVLLVLLLTGSLD